MILGKSHKASGGASLSAPQGFENHRGKVGGREFLWSSSKVTAVKKTIRFKTNAHKLTGEKNLLLISNLSREIIPQPKLKS